MYMCVSKRDAPVNEKKKEYERYNICLSTSGRCLFVRVTVENEKKVSKNTRCLRVIGVFA